jgi:hypothetical protein
MVGRYGHNSTGLSYSQSEAFCKHSNELVGSTKAEKFLNGVECLLRKALYQTVWLISDIT